MIDIYKIHHSTLYVNTGIVYELPCCIYK